MAKHLNTADDYAAAIRAGDRLALSRAITLIESTRDDHQKLARDIVNQCMPFSGHGLRIGVTGPPGAGKSTFIDALGAHLVEQKKRVAVLAVDPSSQKSKGSILGDKTRMNRLAADPNSFIRPSPNAGAHGGLTSYTRESLILCGAAGYDILLVETVGVGQSEIEVHSMVDMLLLIVITGAGDDIQGIKRGIMEMADLIIVNKADGENKREAEVLLRSLKQLFRIMPEPRPGWNRQVLTASSIHDEGIKPVYEAIRLFSDNAHASGSFEKNRKAQDVAWMEHYIKRQLLSAFNQHKEMQEAIVKQRNQVQEGIVSPLDAADALLQLYSSRR